jgi:hypothetical protein
MAKNAAFLYDAAVANAQGQAKSAAERNENDRSFLQRAVHRVANYFESASDREAERYIRMHGGTMNDALERELNRHFGRM